MITYPFIRESGLASIVLQGRSHKQPKIDSNARIFTRAVNNSTSLNVEGGGGADHPDQDFFLL